MTKLERDTMDGLRRRVASLEAALRGLTGLLRIAWAHVEPVDDPGAIDPATARAIRQALASPAAPTTMKCPRCKGLGTVPSSVGVGPLNVPCPVCAALAAPREDAPVTVVCSACGGAGRVNKGSAPREGEP